MADRTDGGGTQGGHGPGSNGASSLVPLRVLPEADGDAYLGMTALGPTPTERGIREHALVLQSMSIWHVIKRTPAGWILVVRDDDYARAASAIEAYDRENRDWPPPRRRERLRHELSGFTPIAFALLTVFFLVTGPSMGHSFWFTRGTAVTQLVLGGQPWRAVTALTLHGDGVHILGNAISGTIFAGAVNRRLGPGAGFLAILASGILGNVGNAIWHQSMRDGLHGSIGASTAVFGAIGILAATQVAVNRRPRTEPWRFLDIAAPIVGGFALLGALGAGEHSDLGAHLFGLVAGVLIGFVAAMFLRTRQQGDASFALEAGSRVAHEHVSLGSGIPSRYLQAAMGAAALAIVIASWAFALRFRV